MRRYVIANWKMHLKKDEALKLGGAMVDGLPCDLDVGIVVCAPFVYLDALQGLFSGSCIGLGAQNMHWEEEGAFTGEISPVMLRSVGCEYVILGHSERRHIFGETDDFINRKVKAALNHALIPVVCVGETLKERQSGKAREVVQYQVDNSLKDVNLNDVLIAYEPVWAIGTGVAADVDTVKEMHDFVKDITGAVVLYGGSVKPENAVELSKIDTVDGFLVGGASLSADKFGSIIRNFCIGKGC